MPEHHSHFLQEIVILLLIAVVIVTFFKKIKLSPVLGYLVAGSFIGSLGLIKDIETTKFIAEFGVVFLLFTIGLELTFERLKSMRLHIFGFGTIQVFLTGGLIGLICYAFGLSDKASIIIGASLAISSTAVVLQVLSEQGSQASQVGRLSLATLIMQDLAVVPLLIMIPLLASESNNNLFSIFGEASLKAIVVILFIFVVGRKLLRPILNLISSLRSRDLFIASILLTILGIAFLTQSVGLSLPLGALLAGLLVAETEYKAQVEADISPFKGLFLGLFFMTVGMQIDFNILKQDTLQIFLLTIALVLVKAVTIIPLALAFKINKSCAIKTGLTLAQGSEFAFVLFAVAIENMIFGSEISSKLLLVVSISMAITPFIVSFGNWITKTMHMEKNPILLSQSELSEQVKDLDSHIIVVGMGRVGTNLSNLFVFNEQTNFAVIDSDIEVVTKARQKNYPIYYGKAERIEVFNSLGIERSQMVALTMKDAKISEKIIKIIRKYYPDLPIIARAYNKTQMQSLLAAGATEVMLESFESSLLVGHYVFKTMGLTEPEADRIIDSFKRHKHNSGDV